MYAIILVSVSSIFVFMCTCRHWVLELERKKKIRGFTKILFLYIFRAISFLQLFLLLSCGCLGSLHAGVSSIYVLTQTILRWFPSQLHVFMMSETPKKFAHLYLKSC